MTTAHHPPDRLLQAALIYLAGSALLVGIPATLAPQTFFDDFPFVANWVDLLGVYNEHLTTDTGGLYLGFALLFTWAAVTPDRALVRPLCFAWLVAQTLHLVFHLTHLDGYSVADGVTQTASLVALVAVGLLVLARARSEGRPA